MCGSRPAVPILPGNLFRMQGFSFTSEALIRSLPFIQIQVHIVKSEKHSSIICPQLSPTSLIAWRWWSLVNQSPETDTGQVIGRKEGMGKEERKARVLVRVTLAGIKHHDPKHLEEERVCSACISTPQSREKGLKLQHDPYGILSHI